MDNAINGNDPESDQAALAAVAASAGIEVPAVIAELFSKPIAHPVVVEKQDIESEILQFLEAGSQGIPDSV
jgi:threonine synthase